MALSKAELLDGSRHAVTVHIDELGDDVVIYPLTESQWAQVELKQREAVGFGVDASKLDLESADTREQLLAQIKPTLHFDFDKLQLCQIEADAMAVAFSLSAGGEDYTVEEVREIRPAGAVAAIARKVFEISHVDGDVTSRVLAEGGLQTDVEQFRGDTGGTAPGGNGGAPSAAGADGE